MPGEIASGETGVSLGGLEEMGCSRPRARLHTRLLTRTLDLSMPYLNLVWILHMFVPALTAYIA